MRKSERGGRGGKKRWRKGGRREREKEIEKRKVKGSGKERDKES